jgi:hypothetical protein
MSFFSISAVCAQQQSSASSFFGTEPTKAEPESTPDNLPNYKLPTKMPSAGGDYSKNEKVAQRRYNRDLAYAQDSIARAERLMAKSAPGSKEYKHGKVLKEIAEKSLFQLKANNPFPDPPEIKKKQAEKQ